MVAALYNSPPPITNTYLDEMRAFGFSEGEIKQQTTAPTDDIYVLEENWVAVLWFFETQDCYQYSDSGVCLGLDLTQVSAEKILSERKTSPDDFEKLKEMARENTGFLNRSLESNERLSKKYAAPPD